MKTSTVFIIVGAVAIGGYAAYRPPYVHDSVRPGRLLGQCQMEERV